MCLKLGKVNSHAAHQVTLCGPMRNSNHPDDEEEERWNEENEEQDWYTEEEERERMLKSKEESEMGVLLPT